jgi:signal peptidase II
MLLPQLALYSDCELHLQVEFTGLYRASFHEHIKNDTKDDLLYMSTAMRTQSKLAVLIVTIFGCLGCDQITKIWAQHKLQGHSSLSLIDGFYYFVYAENTGTVFGIGSHLPEDMRALIFIYVVGVVITAVSAFVLIKSMNGMTVFALSLVVGGGIGNLVDRLIRDGSVVDFMLIKVGSLESGIFNLADVAITLGIILVSCAILGSRQVKT